MLNINTASASSQCLDQCLGDPVERDRSVSSRSPKRRLQSAGPMSLPPVEMASHGIRHHRDEHQKSSSIDEDE